MTREEADAVLDAATRRLVDAALRLIEDDPHSFGTRPCQTCTAVSALVGRPFGCSSKRKNA